MTNHTVPPTTKAPPSIVAIVFTIVMTLVGWLGFWAFASDLHALDERGVPGIAKVIDVSTGSKTSFYELELLVGDHPTMNFDLPAKLPRVGQVVPVEYDPTDPSVFRPKGQRIESGLIGLPILSTVGTVAAVVQIVLRRRRKV